MPSNPLPKIRLQFSLPLLCGAFAVVAVWGGFLLSDASGAAGLDPFKYRLLWTALAVLGGVAAGLALVRFLARPVERFVSRAKRLPVLHRDHAFPSPAHATSARSPSAAAACGPPGHGTTLDLVFDQVLCLLEEADAEKRLAVLAGTSGMVRAARGLIRKFGPTDAPVLIWGEVGSGRERVARTIWEQSARYGAPFAAVAVSAVPPPLLEAELFGIAGRGGRPGRFAAADGGTVYLDEIAALPPAVQGGLRRLLLEGRAAPVGGTERPLDVRIVAASTHSPEELAASGSCRRDLLEALGVCRIEVVPLRRRREDIPELAAGILAERCGGRPLSPDAVGLLCGYDWPGNVGELRAVLERAAAEAGDGAIGPAHLPRHFAAVPSAPAAVDDGFPLDGGLDDYLARIERETIVRALRTTDGVQARAAELLGIKDRSLWHRVKKYGIDPLSVKK